MFLNTVVRPLLKKKLFGQFFFSFAIFIKDFRKENIQLQYDTVDHYILIVRLSQYVGIVKHNLSYLDLFLPIMPNVSNAISYWLLTV